MNESNNFVFSEDVSIEDLGQGVTRQILGYNEELMVVKVWFDTGAEGYVHSHPHSQVTYVESGEFDVNVGGEIKQLKAGDSFYIPPYVEHGAVCKRAGILLDTFSPVREDFLKQS
ncbi:cupin domain-containing protein [Catenovulum sediminis]|uniref:cupin domain-containing protein n=1 Tax=Catenovulum sediminis TaxID=1740262 RepID=UPI00117E4333|nr:cupin domain-containing protein [Catenovulum sediminis]